MPRGKASTLVRCRRAARREGAAAHDPADESRQPGADDGLRPGGCGRRLRDRGEPSIRQLRRSIAAACALADVERFEPGSFRHTVSRFAKNHGAHPKSIADFLNHQSEETNRRFYALHAVPAKVPTPR